MSRTIFLFIRGIDQSSRAFAKANKELTNIQRLQRDLARSSYRLLFAGAAFSLFAVKASQGILGLMERTSQGALVVDDFRRSWGKLMDALSERFTAVATPWIDNLIKQMNTLSAMPKTLDWIVKIGVGLTGAAIVGAVGSFILSGLTSLAGFVVMLLEAVGMGWLVMPGTISSAAAGIGGFITNSAAYAFILPAIPVAVPIIITALLAWGLFKWLGDKDIAAKIKDAITEGSLSTQYGLEPTDLMTEHGIQGIDYYSQGGAGDVLPSAGTYAVEINVDVHDNDINADDPDSVGSSVGTSLADQLKNFIDGR